MKIPIKAMQTVTPDGQSIAELIDGVKLFHPQTHQDERGTLCEMYSTSWNFDDVPMVHSYLVTVRPGKVKGWAVHDKQIDRYFFVSGSLKLVLFDSRIASPTNKMINELFFSELNRTLVSVPPGVFHAVENVGLVDGLMFNIPSHPYSYTDPDKQRLPLENDLIPYSFKLNRGH